MPLDSQGKRYIFNHTLLLRGATPFRDEIDGGIVFSIHAPLASDSECVQWGRQNRFSIHAPLARSDDQVTDPDKLTVNFPIHAPLARERR